MKSKSPYKTREEREKAFQESGMKEPDKADFDKMVEKSVKKPASKPGEK